VSRRIRPLIAVALAVIVVAGLVAADVVTLHKAKPSYDHETQAFNRMLGSPTTTVPTKTTVAKSPGASPTGASPNSAVTPSTVGTSGITGTPASTSGNSSTTPAASGSP
jgi:hypothetical protein